MDSYIYWSVIVPLQGLDIPTDNTRPIVSKHGSEIAFYTARERVVGDFHHNYQRDLARAIAKDIVLLQIDGNEFIVADFDRRTHNVNVYFEPFNIMQIPLLGNRLVQAFESELEFKKVKTHFGGRRIDRHVTEEELFNEG